MSDPPLDLLRPMLSQALAHPLAAVLVAALVVGVLLAVRSPRSAVAQRDPRRAFTRDERARGFARADYRCEHRPLLGLRCANSAGHGDHVYPWSRGGATTLANFQASCPFHNTRKADRVPSRFYLWRLACRRRRYFPDGEDPRVEWRIGPP